jgi:hypothetical protein
MINLNDEISSFLHSFREEKLLASDAEVSEALVTSRVVTIGKKDFLLNCWEEKSGYGHIVCVELSRRGSFTHQCHSVGVKITGNRREKLDQEQMWNMGY